MAARRKIPALSDDELQLREIQWADFERLLAWRNHEPTRRMFANSEPVTREQHTAFLEKYFDPSNQDLWFIIEAHGKPVGTVALYDFREHGRRVEWGRLIVDPDCRGRRYARRVFLLLSDYCHSIGVKAIRSEVLVENTRTVDLHHTLEFSEVGRRRVGSRELVIFSKELQ